MSDDKNKKLAMKLAMIAVVMFGFGYVLVPIYNVFCDVAGLNGKTGELSTAEANKLKVAKDRVITVTFDTNVNGDLPWKFKAKQVSVKVHPGEAREVMFWAENTADRKIVGQAIPSVAPAKASVYFKKTECFCFSQQTLAPKESRDMPVRFVIEPDVPEEIKTLTLSYTFFEAPGQVASQANNN
jgi:cytochrome c oxidase assembly protein subunit 11